MKKLILAGSACLFINGCSHLGNIDRSRLETPSSYRLSSGQQIQLPLRYDNWKWMMASYSAPVDKLKTLLPEKLEPIRITPKQGLISFGVLEYPKVTGLEPYNEWLIAIPVQYDPPINIPFLPALYNPLFPHRVYNKGGSYIYYLPVSTQESKTVGSEIWGFPKVQREIQCSENTSSKTCQLINNGNTEMRLRISKIPLSFKQSDFNYCTYTKKNENLLRTCIPAKGDYGYSFSANASIDLGNGTIAQQLKPLNIKTTQAVQVFMGKNLSSLLPLEYQKLKP